MQRRSQQALSALRQILRATENYARKLARETGLTASQLLLLQVLDEHGETTAGQIAAHMGITQATTTSLLDAETIDAAPVLDVGAIDREQH